jgi:hypothetical protein
MTGRDRRIAARLKEELFKAGGEAVLRVLCFGSRVRGQARRDSDLDVAVIVQTRTQALQLRLDDAAYQVMWDNDFSPIISLKIFGNEEFAQALRQGFAFYRNLDAEGMEL